MHPRQAPYTLSNSHATMLDSPPLESMKTILVQPIDMNTLRHGIGNQPSHIHHNRRKRSHAQTLDQGAKTLQNPPSSY